MPVKFSLGVRAGRAADRPRVLPKENGIYLRGQNGATVILIHGLTGTPYEMRYLATSLNKRGYSVACPRLANHGGPIEVLKRTRWQEFYGSVRSLLVSGEIASSDGPIFMSGLSMGALLALLAADEFRQRVWGTSCLAPTLFYDGWNVPWTRHLLPLAYFTPLRHFYYFKEEPPYGIKNEAIRQRVHNYYQHATLYDVERVGQYGYPYIPVTLFCELRLLVKHLMKRLPHFDTPVQLIQAKDDDMTSTKNSQFIYERVRSGEKEMVLLYNSYHVITADQERETVAEKMADFFSRIRSSLAHDTGFGRSVRERIESGSLG